MQENARLESEAAKLAARVAEGAADGEERSMLQDILGANERMQRDKAQASRKRLRLHPATCRQSDSVRR